MLNEYSPYEAPHLNKEPQNMLLNDDDDSKRMNRFLFLSVNQNLRVQQLTFLYELQNQRTLIFVSDVHEIIGLRLKYVSALLKKLVNTKGVPIIRIILPFVEFYFWYYYMSLYKKRKSKI